MRMTIQAAAYKLADFEHELDTHLWQVQSNPAFVEELDTQYNELRDSIPDEIYFTPEFFAAYGERRAERNAQSERGQPFTVIDGDRAA